MTSVIDLICFKCKHWHEFDDGCKAFPEGIPDSILIRNKHAKPIKNQKNNLVFECDN
ncbi:cytoplasmic protein [Winogradskyella helgolandensis]|uniref:cytoplasmic protein n=1 Tax=Winogradskyella helgolandensis TaxID=2697010 RepID=UPI0015CB18AF|nr:cytoplasmic protein [Winogradskyella helgolandensis]